LPFIWTVYRIVRASPLGSEKKLRMGRSEFPERTILPGGIQYVLIIILGDRIRTMDGKDSPSDACVSPVKAVISAIGRI